MAHGLYKGSVCLVLHAHLPYIRHPEYDYCLEENWLYEAITETYIPLLDVFSRLINDGIDFRITISLSPALVEMFNDDLLMSRYRRHIEHLMELSEREAFRIKGDIHFEPIVKMYHERFLMVRHVFEDIYRGDLVSAFRALEDTGKVEIITTAATHAFLPHLASYPQAVKAQIKTGAEQHRKNFRGPAKGIWLPECGFSSGFDTYLNENGIRFFFLEAHGVVLAKPLPRCGVYAPILCPSNVAAFGRDPATAKQVWSSLEGYPGDYDYRDFYRDIGYDLDLDYIKSYNNRYGARTYTGLKYYRITGNTSKKEPYIRQRAMEKAAAHADNFIMNRELQIKYLLENLRMRPIVVAAYDAELFGHWWFEGPEWLENLFRRIYSTNVNFKTVTPSEYLSFQAYSENLQVCEPSMSSWGDKGFHEVWLNNTNDYVYRHLLKATERMIILADRFPSANGILQRAMNQAAREILLSQFSDWTFIMKQGSFPQYAKRRFEEHISRFNILYQAIVADTIPGDLLSAMEDKDRIFKDIDYRVYSSKQ